MDAVQITIMFKLLSYMYGVNLLMRCAKNTKRVEFLQLLNESYLIVI